MSTTLALAVLLALTAQPDLPAWPEPPPVSASAYVVVDVATGQQLAAREADRLRPVASTIKILTALSVLRRARLDEVVTVGEEVETAAGAGVGLQPGDQWTVEQLLQAMIARSGNDAAVALAAHVGGSVDRFVGLMRADAGSMGLEGIQLDDPTGLSDRNRLSARHLAALARAALADPEFRRVSTLASVDLPRGGPQTTRNLLLLNYPDATGIKTGQTAAAGWSIVGSAERRDREVVAVVLDAAGDEDRFTDAAALLTHGLDAFHNVSLSSSLRLRDPGGWIDLAPDLEPVVTVPVGARPAIGAIGMPIETDVEEIAVEAHIDEVKVSSWVVRPKSTDLEPNAVTAEASIGWWLWDRAYAAMRATTAAEEWPR
ncbi:MAG: serine hydrolase [Actinobacteria bacterium]|nr:serine hydrolase [Actinomycetota bacterium]